MAAARCARAVCPAWSEPHDWGANEGFCAPARSRRGAAALDSLVLGLIRPSFRRAGAPVQVPTSRQLIPDVVNYCLGRIINGSVRCISFSTLYLLMFYSQFGMARFRRTVETREAGELDA